MTTYEYSILTEAGRIKEGSFDPGVNVGASFAVTTQPLLKLVIGALDSFQGGGWEIVSHNFSVIEQNLIATFVIRRPTR